MHLGVDLGGTKTEVIVLDKHSEELFRKRVPSPQGSYEQTLTCINELIKLAETSAGKQCSIGIGIPGAIDPDTQCVKNANSTWLIGHPLQQDLETKLSRPITLANDADCFALSEASDGAGKGFGTVFGVILGTGVGGGLVCNGQLLSGPNAICGEWGHNPLPVFSPENIAAEWQGEQLKSCYCGKHNCIETFLSGPGMASRYMLASHTSSHDIIQAMREGEPQAQQYFERYLDQLARALASVINMLDPSCIVLGGGMSNIDELYPALPKYLSQYIFSDTLKTPIRRAQHGDSSGVRGAAWLGMNTQPTQSTNA